MTTPDNGTAERPKLTKAEREHVYRQARAAPTPPASSELEPGIKETAQVVQLAYSVIGENLKQGREAAAKLRQGQYRISKAPEDLEAAGKRVLDLARALSSTSLDFGERLLGEMRGVLKPVEEGKSVPAFRALVGKAVASSGGLAAAARLKLNVRFVGVANAKTHTSSVERPKPGVQHGQLRVTALVSRSSGAKLDVDVAFEEDLSVVGVIVRVDVKSVPPDGLYSGVVYVEGETDALGTLTIEFPE